MPEDIDEQLDPENDSDLETAAADDSAAPSPGPRGTGPSSPGGPPGPSGPRNNTQQEVAYLRRLIDQHTPVSVKIRGGEMVTGVIEYYDSSFIRLTREGQSNLFIFKKDILYLREDVPLEETAPPETAPEDTIAS